ncbi:Uncharacterized protein Fot_24950 [Forsythia ovata]|uniref:Uncharacterized protein n=1 Tax=Forsythia ovata TaxID=205694 RepID=A0ABD1U7U0_9LAMI
MARTRRVKNVTAPQAPLGMMTPSPTPPLTTSTRVCTYRSTSGTASIDSSFGGSTPRLKHCSVSTAPSSWSSTGALPKAPSLPPVVPLPIGAPPQTPNFLTTKTLPQHELDSTQDLSLQCYFRPLHAGLVGALPLQYTGYCVDVVCFLQQFATTLRVLQKASALKYAVAFKY